MSGRTFLLQDWITIRSSLSAAFTQDPQLWLDLNGFADATCWIDVTEVTPPAGVNTNSLALTIQTAPSCDDAYFLALAPTLPTAPPGALNFGTAAPFALATTTPFVIRSANTLTSNNLMRYLRWQITPSAAGSWDITFRIRVVANRSTAFVPTLLPGCVLWLRSDIGVGTTGSSVTSWADQSGSGNNATSTNDPTYVPSGGGGAFAAGVNNLPYLSVATGNSMGGGLTPNVSTHTLFAVLSYPSGAPPFVDYAAFAATDALSDVKATFPSPNPSLALVSADITALTSAETDLRSRTGTIAVRDGKKKSVVADMQSLHGYVQGLASANPAQAGTIADEAAMKLRSQTIPHKPDLGTKQTVSGTVKVIAKATKDARSNMWQQSTDGGKTWVDLPPTTQANMTVHNLTSGSTVMFRQRALLKTGLADWGQPISVLVS